MSFALMAACSDSNMRKTGDRDTTSIKSDRQETKKTADSTSGEYQIVIDGGTYKTLLPPLPML